MRNIKYFALFSIGGLLYGLMEVSWRGHSHISMFVAGGICFLLIGYVAKKYETLGLIAQCGLCALLITSVEFLAGVVVNLWLGLNVWDYSAMAGNFFGQVCPQFSALWYLVSIPAIYLHGWLGRVMFGEVRSPVRLLPNIAKKRVVG